MTSDITGLGVSRLLEAIKSFNSNIKFYQASSSEMYGKITEPFQNEKTPFYPRSPYAVAKLFGHWMTVNYRESYKMFACSGILFNHESPIRGVEFVTRKITQGLSRIKLGLQDSIELGNLDSKRDWGYASDYVQAMYLMLQHDEPDDYVIATGQNHSVREFIELCCDELNIDIKWEGEGLNEVAIDVSTMKPIIRINPIFYRPAEVDVLLGDSSKAKKILKWSPETSFENLVKMMIGSDYQKMKSKC